MNISKYTTAATAQSTTSTKSTSKLVAFCMFLAENHTRLTYKAIDTIKTGRIRQCQPHYQDVLYSIPSDMQWVICNADGKYAGKPLEMWGAVAPEGFMEFPFIKPEQAIEAYAEWLAGEALAAE